MPLPNTPKTLSTDAWSFVTAASNATMRSTLGLGGARNNERNVQTQAQLLFAAAESGALTIYVRQDIALSTIVTMSDNKTLVMGNCQFTQSGGGGLVLYGSLVADRRQIFSGFTAGQIVGTFGRADVYPEWWGLADNNHDIAINCAIRASTLAININTGLPTNNYGIKVSLANRVYNVSAPLDMSAKSVTLEGAGSGLTFISATTAWNATWVKADVWGEATGPANHAAMIWIGGDLLGSPARSDERTYLSKVKGVYINCYNAAYPYRLDGSKRVSGISSKRWVEECSVIHDVVIENASGFGIGFCQHRGIGQDWSGGATGAAVINGLSIRDFWITGPTFRDTYPMYFPQWTNNCSVDTGRIGPSLAKSISSAFSANNVALDPIDGGNIYSRPAWEVTYPLIGIKAQGNLSLSNIHFEGVVIGVHCQMNGSGGNSISLKNLNFLSLHDPIRGSIYINDGRSGVNFTTNAQGISANAITYNITNDAARYFGYGCGVLISKDQYSSEVPTNYFDRVTISGIHGAGGVTYLLRDASYGHNILAYGMGQNPNSSGGGISFYSRGNVYAHTTTLPYSAVGGGAYDRNNTTSPASTSRQFFIGPIY
jgi:hypothetical protein